MSATSPPSSTRGSAERRTREPPPELQGRILSAAIDEFSAHGYAGARIDRISRAAGTVDRMIYYYFGAKEPLYRAVLERVFADLIAAQRNFQMPPDPVDAMRRLIEHSWDHYVGHPALVRLLMSENLEYARHFEASQTVRESSRSLVDTTRQIVERGQSSGAFRTDVSTEHALLTIMSLGFFYLSNQYTCSTWIGLNLRDDAERAAWRRHIVDVVLTYLRPPSR